MTDITFRTLQLEVSEWANRNFGSRDQNDPLLGAVEEIGELCHAVLKAKQGIRGTAEQHQEAAKDAVGDVIVYLADFCALRGFSLQDIVQDTWEGVKQRDWTKNPANGNVTAVIE